MEHPFSNQLEGLRWDELEEILSSPLPPDHCNSSLHPPSPLLLNGVAQLSIASSTGMASPIGSSSPVGAGQSFLGLHSPTSTAYSGSITTPDSTIRNSFSPSHHRSRSSDSRPGTKRTRSGNVVEPQAELLHPSTAISANRPHPRIDTSNLMFADPSTVSNMQQEEPDMIMSVGGASWASMADNGGDNSDDMEEDSKDQYGITGGYSGGQQVSPSTGKSSAGFVTKLYAMMQDPSASQYVFWAQNGASFFIKNTPEFQSIILPAHFKHNNIASFVRQLNMYDFHKVNKVPRSSGRTSDAATLLEFKHARFLRDRPDLLNDIKRKVTEAAAAQAGVEASPAGPQPTLDYIQTPSSTQSLESKFDVFLASHQRLSNEVQQVRQQLKDERESNASMKNKFQQLVDVVKFMRDQMFTIPQFKDAFDRLPRNPNSRAHHGPPHDVFTRTTATATIHTHADPSTGVNIDFTGNLDISPLDPNPPLLRVSHHTDTPASNNGLGMESLYGGFSNGSLLSPLGSEQGSPVTSTNGFSPSMQSTNGLELLKSPLMGGSPGGVRGRHAPSLSMGSIPQQPGISPIQGHSRLGSLPNAMNNYNSAMAGSSTSFQQAGGHLSPTSHVGSSPSNTQFPNYGQHYPPPQSPQYDNSTNHSSSPISIAKRIPQNKRARRDHGPQSASANFQLPSFGFSGTSRGDTAPDAAEPRSNEADAGRLNAEAPTLVRSKSASSLGSNNNREWYTPTHSPATSTSGIDGEALFLGQQNSSSSVNLASRPGSSSGPGSANQVPKIEETFVDVSSFLAKIEQ